MRLMPQASRRGSNIRLDPVRSLRIRPQQGARVNRFLGFRWRGKDLTQGQIPRHEHCVDRCVAAPRIIAPAQPDLLKAANVVKRKGRGVVRGDLQKARVAPRVIAWACQSRIRVLASPFRW